MSTTGQCVRKGGRRQRATRDGARGEELEKKSGPEKEGTLMTTDPMILGHRLGKKKIQEERICPLGAGFNEGSLILE